MSRLYIVTLLIYTGEFLGIVGVGRRGGGNLPSVAGVTRPYTSPLPQAPALAFTQSWGGSGHRSTSA